MALLLDLFDGARPNLSRQWQDQPSPPQTARRARRYFDTLIRDYDKRQPLSSDDKRTLMLLGDLLQESSALLNVHSASAGPTAAGDTDKGPPKLLTLIKKVIHPVLIMLLLIWLLAVGQFTILIPLVLLAATILPLRTLFRPKEWRSYLLSEQDISKEYETRSEPIQIGININSLLTQLRSVISKADAILVAGNQEEAEQSAPANPLHAAKDVLGLFQSLLEAEAFQDSEYAIKTIRGIRNILARHGIGLERYQDGRNDSHFEFEFDNNAESDSRITTRFALITDDGQLLLPGTVLDSRKEEEG